MYGTNKSNWNQVAFYDKIIKNVYNGLNKMKKISALSFLVVALITVGANATYDDKKFTDEISKGLDLISAEETFEYVQDEAPGELGREVYEFAGTVNSDDIRLFVPTSHYMRMGVGLNMGFASSKANTPLGKTESNDSYSVQIGLGWNLSSYVRAEIDLQMSEFKFQGIDNTQATQQTLGGMLYFDFARRYVQMGDITKRRTFVPFMGIGAGFGTYDYQGKDGKDGMLIAAPRAALGFNVMLGDLIGVDVMYQYQMLIGNGFGWGTDSANINNVSNIMATIRMNF